MAPPTPQPVALVIGASRGIGRQIALDLALAGYAVVVAAKSFSPSPTTAPFPPDPNSPLSTVNTVAREITLAGGTALPLPVDTTSQESITRLIASTIAVRIPDPSPPHRHKLIPGAAPLPPRRPNLQLGRHLVGPRQGYPDQALPADAARQRRRAVRRGAGGAAAS